jgi:hypothetical protein
MIPHATVAPAGSVGALLVPVIGTPFVAGPVLSSRLAGRPPTPLPLAPLAAVDVPAVATAVDPELSATALAVS